MRFKFIGPEGAVFAGHEYPATSLDNAELEHVAALQRATGRTMKTIIEESEEVEAFGLQCALFLTLHANCHPVGFDTVKHLKFADFEVIEEPGDSLEGSGADDSEAPSNVEGPTTPSTVTGPVVDGARSTSKS